MKPTPQQIRWAGLLLVPLLLVAAFAVGERAGWPWLAGPLERALSERLGRSVELVAAPGGERLRIALLGELHLQADRLRIGGPSWRGEVNTLDAGGISLRLRYRDLWSWQRGAKTLRIKELTAQTLEADLMRRADGSASWMIVPTKAAPAEDAAATDTRPLLQLEHLLLNEARLIVDDAPLRLKARIQASLSEQPAPARPAGLGLSARAEGRYLGRPLQATLETGSPLPWLGAANAQPVAMSLRLEAGRARLSFDGAASNLLGLDGLAGKVRLSGPRWPPSAIRWG